MLVKLVCRVFDNASRSSPGLVDDLAVMPGACPPGEVQLAGAGPRCPAIWELPER